MRRIVKKTVARITLALMWEVKYRYPVPHYNEATEEFDLTTEEGVVYVKDNEFDPEHRTTHPFNMCWSKSEEQVKEAVRRVVPVGNPDWLFFVHVVQNPRWTIIEKGLHDVD